MRSGVGPVVGEDLAGEGEGLGVGGVEFGVVGFVVRAVDLVVEFGVGGVVGAGVVGSVHRGARGGSRGVQD